MRRLTCCQHMNLRHMRVVGLHIFEDAPDVRAAMVQLCLQPRLSLASSTLLPTANAAQNQACY